MASRAERRTSVPRAAPWLVLLLLATSGLSSFTILQASFAAHPGASVGTLSSPLRPQLSTGPNVCQSVSSGTTMTTTGVAVPQGAALYLTTYVASGTATVAYEGGTYNGVTTIALSSSGANWGSWNYAQDLPATSSLVLVMNTTGSTEFGLTAVIVDPTSSAYEVVLDTISPLGSETEYEVTATLTTSHAPEWIGMGAADNDGTADLSVGTGETVLNDCNVQGQQVYLGMVDRTNLEDFEGSITVTANYTHYGGGDAIGFYEMTAGTQTCGGGSGSTASSAPLSVPSGSAVYATVWLGTGTATMWYQSGTYHGNAATVNSATGANWQGWYYAQDLPATSSLVLEVNASTSTVIGIASEVIAPLTAGDSVLYDASGSPASGTLTQSTVSVTTSQSGEWVVMGYSDGDGTADMSVGTGETVLSDCNVPSQTTYLGIITRTSPVGFAGSVTLIANNSHYSEADASSFYEGPPGGTLALTSFTASPSSVTVGQTSTLTVGAVGGTRPYGYAYSGLPSGCATSSTASLSCTPTGAGTFTVRVWVNDSVGGSASTNTVLTVTTGPLTLSSFAATPSSVDLGQTTSLTVSASGGAPPYHYTYTGLPAGCASANGATLACTPTVAGTFALRAYANDTASASVTGTAPLTVNPALVLSGMSASPTTVAIGSTSTISLTASGGTAPDHYAYAGLPPGCASSNSASLACIPSAEGTYSVAGWVNDSTGASVGGSVSITVVGVGVTIASFTSSSSVIDVGGTTTLSVSASGGTLPYHFAFTGLPANCPTQDASSVACVPLTSGTFVVTAWVNDSAGHGATAVAHFTVDPAVAVSADATPNPADAGVPVVGQATGSGGDGVYTYSWRWGDGGTSTSSTALETFPQAGSYPVRVWVNDSLGGTASSTLVVKVDPALQATAAAVPNSTTVGTTIPFSASVTGGTPSYSYSWEFGDGATSSAESPTHAYDVAGDYRVYLTVNDSAGGFVIASTVVYVSPPPVPQSSGLPPLDWWFLIVLLAVVVVVVLVVVLRRRSPPPAVALPPGWGPPVGGGSFRPYGPPIPPQVPASTWAPPEAPVDPGPVKPGPPSDEVEVPPGRPPSSGGAASSPPTSP